MRSAQEKDRREPKEASRSQAPLAWFPRTPPPSFPFHFVFAPRELARRLRGPGSRAAFSPAGRLNLDQARVQQHRVEEGLFSSTALPASGFSLYLEDEQGSVTGD